ncbi:MAG: hypothetical protein HY690_08460 [Chloroflexi bacterium]|nr:hypothetical protein [Chloroflexota bacterium]
MKLPIAALGVLIAALLLPAAAAAGGKGTTTTTGFTLVSETRSGYAPWDCYHEDSYHDRVWAGSLAPGESFAVALPFCTFDQFVSGPGGAGFLMRSYGSGHFSLAAVSPSGLVYPAHLMSTKGGSEDWRRCIVQPRFDAVQQIGFGTIEPGVWTVAFANLGDRLARSLSLQITVNQAGSGWQQAVCPAQDWNFT